MGPNPQETADLVTLLVIIYTETTFLILYYLFPEAQIMVGKSIHFIFHC